LLRGVDFFSPPLALRLLLALLPFAPPCALALPALLEDCAAPLPDDEAEDDFEEDGDEVLRDAMSSS
jgi:hypothetical protein